MTNAMANATSNSPETVSAEQSLILARQGVRDLLCKSQAFREMPPDKQREIAKNTVEVVNYLIRPEGIAGTQLATAQQLSPRNDDYALQLAEGDSGPGKGEFKAQASREGARVAGVLLREVSFPQFVSGLITGVFDSIVDSSIKQMEAYGSMVASVAKSLNQFRDENVTANQGRDYLVEQHPETFMLDIDTGDAFSEGGGPRIRLRDGVDERTALEKVNRMPMEGGPMKSLDLEDEQVEQRLVQAARTQLATSRQQLLATMVLMGINRIVVTDGRISAKVMYDFRAKEKFKRTATDFDYENFGTKTTSEGEYESQREGPTRTYSSEGSGKDREVDYERRGGSYYATGKYKSTSEPAVQLTSATAEATEAALQTRASLAGNVEVNFKSETFPLEKMADSFQIGQIQNAAEPGATGAPAQGTPVAPATGTSPTNA